MMDGQEITIEDARIKVGLIGGRGKLGRIVREELESCGITSFTISRNSMDAVKQADIIFECAGADATPTALRYAALNGIGLCIVSSGHAAQALVDIKATSADVPILKIDNLSRGHVLQQRLTQQLLLDPVFRHISIFERHAPSKLDAPSGTAKKLARLCNTEEIAFTREGGPVADHTVIARSEFETIEIVHRVHSLRAAAQGARDALIAFSQISQPGLYEFDGECCQMVS
jgi:4-hydroxy-tetrahydrodipicolinate reductase